MKLIFKYVLHKDWRPKSYIRICSSYRRIKEIPEEINLKDFWNLILKKDILNEFYLANYLFDTNLSLAKFVLDKLNNKDINDYDISSQGWDVDLEKEKVIISQIYSSGDKRKACINREEVSYAMLKWKNFLERGIDNPEYQEIIDTEEVYKKER